MSIEGQGHFFTIYFPGFVCSVLYEAKISDERLQDHWSSGLCLDVSFKMNCLHLGQENAVCSDITYQTKAQRRSNFSKQKNKISN